MTNGNGNTGGFAPGGFQPPAVANPMAAPGGVPMFVVDIDADPTWEPMERFDVLAQDGLYCVKVTAEKVRTEGDKTPGVFISLQIQDEDTKGKIISKFMTDPKSSKNDTRFAWRLLILSLTGDKGQARSAFRYTPGAITGRTVYVKTKAGFDNQSRPITNVDNFVTREDYEAAVKENRHRWKPEAASTPGGVPAGMFPPASPGFGGLGSLGAPSSPTPGGMPLASPTAVTAAAAQTFAPPAGFPPSAPAQAFTPPTVAPAAFPGQTQSTAPAAPAPVSSPFPGFPGAQ